jgi:hypothetical protein
VERRVESAKLVRLDQRFPDRSSSRRPSPGSRRCRAAELPGREHASMARDQTAVLAHQRRRRPAPFLDAGGYRGNLAHPCGCGRFSRMGSAGRSPSARCSPGARRRRRDAEPCRSAAGPGYAEHASDCRSDPPHGRMRSGEPGIGKSRLTAALSAHIESEPHTQLRYFGQNAPCPMRLRRYARPRYHRVRPRCARR